MTNRNSELLYPSGSDLASRASARNLRVKAEQTVETGKIAVIDLTNVVSVSESYADELFAILIEQHGLEWFSDNIKLQYQPNSNDILLSIATAIRYRLEKQESNSIKASIDGLIAAKKTNKSKSCNTKNI